MRRILCSDWLPNETHKMSHLARPGFLALVPQVKVALYGHKIKSLLSRIVGFRWLDSGLVLFCALKDPRVRLGQVRLQVLISKYQG